jgi:hypothetical protein
MRRLALAVFFLTAVVLAANRESEHAGPAAPGALARQIRMKQVIGLSEALELSEADALRMAQVIRSFQERRRPFQEQVSEAARTIKRAADGEPDALARVDMAVQQMYAGRAQLVELNKEMFSTLGQGLTAQQRAKMAVYFAKFHMQLRDAQIRRARRMAAAAHGNAPPGTADADVDADLLELE